MKFKNDASIKREVACIDYYGSSSEWVYDIYQSKTVWLNRTILCLLGISTLLALSIITNILLLPLKEKVPYLYAFDRSTGEITKIGELDKTTFSSNWEMARYFIIHYVNNYESYDYDNIDVPYQLVWAQSSETVREVYEEKVKSNNPDSPFKLFGKDKYLVSKVISVNKLNDDTADVKFELTLHDRELNSETTTSKEAIIRWKFVNPDTTQKMLDRDPLGFQVTYYQVTQINS